MSLVLKQIITELGKDTQVLLLPLTILDQHKNYWSLFAEAKVSPYGHPMLIKIITNCNYGSDTYYDVLLMEAEWGSPNSEHKLLTEQQLLDLLGIDMYLLKNPS
jgi:hypothetical protein